MFIGCRPHIFHGFALLGEHFVLVTFSKNKKYGLWLWIGIEAQVPLLVEATGVSRSQGLEGPHLFFIFGGS